MKNKATQLIIILIATVTPLWAFPPAPAFWAMRSACQTEGPYGPCAFAPSQSGCEECCGGGYRFCIEGMRTVTDNAAFPPHVVTPTELQSCLQLLIPCYDNCRACFIRDTV